MEIIRLSDNVIKNNGTQFKRIQFAFAFYLNCTQLSCPWTSRVRTFHSQIQDFATTSGIRKYLPQREMLETLLHFNKMNIV